MTQQQGVSASRLRGHNRSAVLALIGRRGPISRAEIASTLGLSPATVTMLTRGLLEDGIITRVGQGPSRGRRGSGELLAIAEETAEAFGIKLSPGGLITGIRASLRGGVLDQFDGSFDAPGANPFVVLAALTKLLEPRIDRRGPGRPPLLGVGIGLPGYEDPSRPGLVRAPMLGWRKPLQLGEPLSSVLGLPVLIDNDVNTLALAELLYGKHGRTIGNYLVLTLGAGVGLGIVLDGDVYRGARGAAGEFGHITVDPSGQPCFCGKRGCLETVTGEAGLVRSARQAGLLGHEEGIGELLALAAAGDERALAIYRDAAAVLGRAVANLAIALNPEAVIVSGEGMLWWPYLEDVFASTFGHNLLPQLADTIDVLPDDEWNHSKWALGAAALVLRAPFATPMHRNPTIDQIRARLDSSLRADQR